MAMGKAVTGQYGIRNKKYGGGGIMGRTSRSKRKNLLNKRDVKMSYIIGRRAI